MFLVTAKYCTQAVWDDTRGQLISQMRERGLMSLGLLYDYFVGWWYVGQLPLLYEWLTY